MVVINQEIRMVSPRKSCNVSIVFELRDTTEFSSFMASSSATIALIPSSSKVYKNFKKLRSQKSIIES